LDPGCHPKSTSAIFRGGGGASPRSPEANWRPAALIRDQRIRSRRRKLLKIRESYGGEQEPENTAGWSGLTSHPHRIYNNVKTWKRETNMF